MEDSTSDPIQYCKNLIKTHDYPRYLQCAFAPEAIPYYALDAELKHIHQHVSEEMIGHIRYAWWRESLDALAEGKPRQHPVLVALADGGIAPATLTALVDRYREAWPEMPENPPELTVDNVCWQRAESIIARHRANYGNKRRLWLVIRLFFA